MKKKDKTKKPGLAKRLYFPEDEKRHAWLPVLLDAFAVADTGVAVAVRDEEKRSGRKLACSQGCGNCCAHQKDLPFYPHELVGMYWYVVEKMAQPERGVLRARLAKHQPGSECPFLIHGSCSIHPMRPLGCRQFNVFSKPCEEGEDPYYSRNEDVMVPLAGYTDRVFAAVIPLYHPGKDAGSSATIKNIRAQIMNLQQYDWKKLVEAMDKADAGREPAP